MSKSFIVIWNILAKVKVWLGRILPWVIFPVGSFYLMETFHHNPFINLYGQSHILNSIIFVAVALLLWMLILRPIRPIGCIMRP